jgi:hypothetical protein
VRLPPVRRTHKQATRRHQQRPEDVEAEAEAEADEGAAEVAEGVQQTTGAWRP